MVSMAASRCVLDPHHMCRASARNCAGRGAMLMPNGDMQPSIRPRSEASKERLP